MQQKSRKEQLPNIPVLPHDLKHSGVRPSFTLVKKGGEAVNDPLEGCPLCWRRKWCHTGLQVLLRVRST
uniref:Uncharacterized protein n=1 Tax=Arundo donax TaxID=35708 RepID=A0A0A8Y0F1_ARUDO